MLSCGMFRILRELTQQETRADELWAPLRHEGAQASLHHHDLEGFTMFFRSPSRYRSALAHARAFSVASGKPATLLSAGCSVGPELYTLAFMAGKDQDWLKIVGLDISPQFLRLAAEGIYPRHLVGRFPERRKVLQRYGYNYFRVPDELRRTIRIMEPTSVMEMADLGLRCDVVYSGNVLYHLPISKKPSEQLAKVAGYAVVVDCILHEQTMTEAGFDLVENHRYEYAWLKRRAKTLGRDALKLV